MANRPALFVQGSLLGVLLLLGIAPAGAAQQVVRVGLYENPPKVFTNAKGAPSGFFITILKAIAKHEGWQLEYHSCEWDRCLTLLEMGELELMPDVAYSPEREHRFDFHKEVVLSNWSLLYASNPNAIKSILDTDGKRIALIEGGIQAGSLRKRASEFGVKPKLLELDSSDAVLRAVQQGKADAGLVNRLYGLQHARKFGLSPTHVLVESSHLYFATAEGQNGALLDAIDRSLIAMKADEESAYYRALERWINPLERQQTPLWLIWLLEGLVAVVVLLLLLSLTLRHLVKRQTAVLEKKKDDLARSEARYRALFENSQDGIMLSGGDNLIDANPSLIRMFRYPSIEAMRKLRRDDLFPPFQPDGTRSGPTADQRIQEALNVGTARFEWIHRRADGTTFPTEVTLVPVSVQGHELLQATIHDISRRKQHEQELKQLNRALQTLSRVNHTLVHAHDEASLLDTVCRTIVESGGYRLAWVGIAQYDAARTVKPVAQYGFEEGYLESLRISWMNDEYGQGPTGMAIRSAEPALARNIQEDPRFAPWREQALQRGYASSIALPLVSSGTTFGALNIYSEEADAFSESEITLLQEVAEDIAFGIHTQRLRLDHTDIEEERKGHQKRLQDALLQTIQAITVMVEKRDPFTAGHQRRVADLAVTIARELGLDEVRVEGIRFGAMIHDIGNIYVPAEILNRPGRLTDSELKIVQSHPNVGYDIIKDIDFPWPVADMILHHQERLDGSGYPDGLKGEAISLEARIIGVADVIEAMLSHRPFRSSFSVEETLAELEQNRGIKYDEKVVDACLHLFRENNYTLPV